VPIFLVAVSQISLLLIRLLAEEAQADAPGSSPQRTSLCSPYHLVSPAQEIGSRRRAGDPPREESSYARVRPRGRQRISNRPFVPGTGPL